MSQKIADRIILSSGIDELVYQFCQDRCTSLFIEAYHQNQTLKHKARAENFNPEGEKVVLRNDFFEVVSILKSHGLDEELKFPLHQEQLNRLHCYFDHLAGRDGSHHPDLLRMPPHVQEAVFKLNHLIHKHENLYGAHPIPYVYAELDRPRRLELPESEYSKFQLGLDFGDLILHYSQLGKQPLDVWRDDDDEVDPSNIVPLSFVSGEFDLYFGESRWMPERYQKELFEWANGFDQNREYLRLGSYVLAKLDRTKGLGVLKDSDLVKKLDEVSFFDNFKVSVSVPVR